MNTSAMQARALQLSSLYDQLNAARGQNVWSATDLALGFVGDVGDLAKVVQADAGLRSMPQDSAGIAHELADCLWSILVLADRFGIDLEDAFEATMSDLERRVADRLADNEGS